MKSEEEIIEMLAQAIEKKKEWYDLWNSREMGTSQNAECLRNYTALRGVVKTLKWVIDAVHTPLE
jgi:hypothetical protein|tara:strand:- start:1751 stop:1945 length:195 start_codon:yes stop_codon:yes gene_type:complete